MIHSCIEDEHGICFECNRPMRPGVVVSTLEVYMAGGKREGAGRPPSPNPATKLVTVKMTPAQHAKFLELGGSRWLKRLIDEKSLAKS